MSGVSYREVIKSDKSLRDFLSAMADFDRQFCDAVASGGDFTLSLEIHGNCGELLHCRVKSDNFRRPPGVEKRIQGRNNS